MRRATRWATGRALGVTFSSGGSKTVAHMGVILALREAGIEIDAVAGSSGGAIAAAFVACDKDEAWGRRVVADLARLTHFRRLDLNLPPRSALAKGRRLRNAFDKWELGDNLEDASIPTWIVGSDVATGSTVVIHSGSVADAIRASLSVPAVFDPWRLGDRLIIDGAVSNPLPSDILRAGGVGVVIASNVAGQASATEVDGRLPSLGQIVGRMLNTMERERIGALLPLADVVIRPRLSAANTFDFSNVDGALAEGRRAAEEHLAGIRSLLAAASGHGVVSVR
jgi:NTE family protein